MKQHGVIDKTRMLASVVVAVCLLIGRSADIQLAKAHAAGCARGPLALSSWTIPQSRPSGSGWWPLAVYGERIVMVHEPTHEPSGPESITMALAIARSPRLRTVASGAYPHFGVLQRWQLSWPWLVGVVDAQALPGLVDWKLWAGNLLTGWHVVIDRGNNMSAGPNDRLRSFADFDVAGGRVVWTRTAYSLHPGIQTIEHVSLYDLTARRTTTLAIPQPGPRERYANPTSSGSRVVWEELTEFPCTQEHCANHLIDLQLYDLASHRLTTLTHSTFRLGSSFEPGLWRHDLLFLHGFDADSGGRIWLVDLSRSLSGANTFWWQRYPHRIVGGERAIELVVRDGLASWNGGVADLIGGGSAALPLGSVQISGGHALAVQSNPLQPYTLLLVRHRCST